MEKAKEYREKLVETAVELDDAAMEAYLDGKEPVEAKLKRLHPQGTHRRQIRSGAVRLGVQEQRRAAAAGCGGRLSAVAARCAADQGRSTLKEQRGHPQAVDAEPFAALAFKIMNDPFVGSLTFFRIYSGKLESGHMAS